MQTGQLALCRAGETLQDCDAVPSEDDVAAAVLDGVRVADWSAHWPRIGELQRRGLVRVKILTRWTAVLQAVQHAPADDWYGAPPRGQHDA